MIHFIINIALILFGSLYAVKPEWFLKRKFAQDEDIPGLSIRTARVVGIALALLGALGLVFTLLG